MSSEGRRSLTGSRLRQPIGAVDGSAMFRIADEDVLTVAPSDSMRARLMARSLPAVGEAPSRARPPVIESGLAVRLT